MQTTSVYTDENEAIRVPEARVRETARAIFMACGVPEEDATLATDVLVTADLRGVESHGVSNMLRAYVRGYRDGELNARPNWKVVRDAPAAATVDSDGGLGIIIGPKAMEIAIEKARKFGIGVVTIRDGRHLGMISYHAMMALPHDMVGMSMSMCPAIVVPTWGAERRLGTNPIAFAAPAGNEAPFVFDAATSVVPANKLTLANRKQMEIPPGWIAGPDGTPMMDYSPPPEMGDDGIPMADLLPLGSTKELGSHKGYGLGCIVDILAGIMAGSGFSTNPGRPTFGHYVAAYDISAFTDLAEFKRMMDEFLHGLRTTKPAPGHDRVLYAGLHEAETVADRKVRGIPYHPEVVEWFDTACKEMGINSLSRNA